MLSGPDRDRIEAAVRAAETGSAGEIVVLLAHRAGTYKSVPPVYALVGTLVVPWPLLFATDLAAARILTIQAIVALALLAFAALLGPRAVPPWLKRARARAAAGREFVARGMADTRGRTGILLYVALAERYAEVVGDVTIADRVGEAEWRGVIDALLAALDQGRTADALVAAIGRIGAILARHVPPEAEDQDELPNRVIVV